MKHRKVKTHATKGTTGWHGRITHTDNFATRLHGRQGLYLLGEMATNDSIIGASLHACELMLRGAKRHLTPCEHAQAERAVELVECAFDHMRVPWGDTMGQILSFLVFGHSVFEPVYMELADSEEPWQTVWHSFSPRPQLTLNEWVMNDRTGMLDGWWQTTRHGRAWLPRDEMLLFLAPARDGNPMGRSILRPAFYDWYFAREIRQIESIGIERDLAGLPVVALPPEIIEGADGATIDAYNSYQHMLRNIRRDEQEGVIMPLAYDEMGNKLYELSLLSTGGSRQFDTTRIIVRYESRMAMAMMTDFLLLGHDQVGTQALSVSKINVFMKSLDAWLSIISNELNRMALPQLCALNGLPAEAAPKVSFEPPRDVNLTELSNLLKSLTDSEMLLDADPTLHTHIRQVANLPLPDARPMTDM